MRILRQILFRETSKMHCDRRQEEGFHSGDTKITSVKIKKKKKCSSAYGYPTKISSAYLQRFASYFKWVETSKNQPTEYFTEGIVSKPSYLMLYF